MDIKRYENCESRDIDIEYIVKLIQQNKFILPDSQREKEWVSEQDAHYIKSILENKPIGSFIFNKKLNNYYILDGQHRINSIDKFYNDMMGILINDSYLFFNGKSKYSEELIKKTNKKLIILDDDWKKIFLETKIYIKEYINLDDNDMTDIIDSINEGVKNDNVHKKHSQLNNNFYDITSQIIFNKNYNNLKSQEKELLKKYIGYIGTIIDNFDTYVDNNDYKQLNIKHVIRYHNNIMNKTNLDEIITFIKIIFDKNMLNHNDLYAIFFENDNSNIFINMTFYKIYELYKQKKINIFIEKIRKTLIDLYLNKDKHKFKEILDIFDNTI
jgi:hypothetical protein